MRRGANLARGPGFADRCFRRFAPIDLDITTESICVVRMNTCEHRLVIDHICMLLFGNLMLNSHGIRYRRCNFVILISKLRKSQFPTIGLSSFSRKIRPLSSGRGSCIYAITKLFVKSLQIET